MIFCHDFSVIRMGAKEDHGNKQSTYKRNVKRLYMYILKNMTQKKLACKVCLRLSF